MSILHKLHNMYHSRGKRIISLVFVLLLAFCFILPMVASASDVTLDTVVEEKGFGDKVINILSGTTSLTNQFRAVLKDGAANPLRPFALSLVALFFIIETLNKSVSFEKVTIEMVVKLLIRLLIAKILVDNASDILLRIDSIIISSTNNMMKAMNKFNASILLSIDSFITDDGTVPYAVSNIFDWILTLVGVKDMLGNGGLASMLQLVPEGIMKILGKSMAKTVDKAAPLIANKIVAKFVGYGSMTLNTAQGLFRNRFVYIPTSSTGILLVLGTGLVGLIITQLIQVVVSIQIFVTLMLRQIELLILAYLAPIAMAAFVSDEFKGQTKKFMIQFATLSLQAMVIVVMCKLLDKVLAPPFDTSDLGYTTGPDDAWYLQIFSWISDKLMFVLYYTGIYDPMGNHWGYAQFVKVILYSIINPVIVGMMVGKSRQIASTLMGG